MNSDKIIGRIEVYEKIKSRFENPTSRVSITSIGGSGGIGKTYLLTKLLDDTLLNDSSCLVLFPETNKNITFERHITEGLLKSVNNILPATKGYFDETSRVIKALNEIENQHKKELLKLAKKSKELQGIDDAIIDNICNIIVPLFVASLVDKAKQNKSIKKNLGNQGLSSKQIDEFSNLIKKANCKMKLN